MARKSDAHGSDWDPPVVGRGFDDDDGLDFADAPAPQGRKAKPSKSTAKSSARSTAQPSAGAAAQPAVGKSRTRLLAKPPAGSTARSARTAADPAGRPRVGTAAPGTRRRGDELAHDDRPLLTVLVSGEGDEQFDVLVDGRAYWGGSTSPYRFEMRLDPGEHELRVRQRHAMDKQPGEFVPLILAVLLGDGRRGEHDIGRIVSAHTPPPHFGKRQAGGKLVGGHQSAALTGAADVEFMLAERLAHFFARQFDQPQRGDAHQIRARVILAQAFAQNVEKRFALLTAIHVDKVDDDDAAQEHRRRDARLSWWLRGPSTKCPN